MGWLMVVGVSKGSVSLRACTVMATDGTVFHCASTTFTTTREEMPAVQAVALPDLPVVEPGTGDSPGTKTCNVTGEPGSTYTLVEVSEAKPPKPSSTVTNQLVVDAVRNVHIKDVVPLVRLTG